MPANAMKKGRIDFYNNIAGKQPLHPGGVTYHLHYQRPFENGGEIGGWWAVLVTADNRASVAGPFGTESEAEQIARQEAERYGYDFLP